MGVCFLGKHTARQVKSFGILYNSLKSRQPLKQRVIKLINTEIKLYAVRDKKTSKFVNNITNPKHKFWEKKGSCETALKTYAIRYEYLITEGSCRGKLSHPDDLEIVELFCYEKPEALKIAESFLPPIEEMRDFTPEESAAYNKHIEEISTPIIGADGKPVNIFDLFGD